MDIASLYEKLSQDVAKLESRQQNLLKKSISPDDLDIPPQIYIRGGFVEFDINTCNLIIKCKDGVDRTHRIMYYPIECYDSQVLPFPGLDVLIFQTEQGIRINGFEKGGVKIPNAKREQLILKQVDPYNRTWTFAHSSGLPLNLPIPEHFPDNFEFKIGSYYTFKVVDSYPQRFYILDGMHLDPEPSQQYLETIMHSVIN